MTLTRPSITCELRFTIEEVRTVIARAAPLATLIVQLLYGSGLRLVEALMLRKHGR